MKLTPGDFVVVKKINHFSFNNKILVGQMLKFIDTEYDHVDNIDVYFFSDFLQEYSFYEHELDDYFSKYDGYISDAMKDQTTRVSYTKEELYTRVTSKKMSTLTDDELANIKKSYFDNLSNKYKFNHYSHFHPEKIKKLHNHPLTNIFADLPKSN